jgi:hypothetical protein
MHPIHTMALKLVTAGALALTALGTTGCYGEVYGSGDPAYYPNDGFLATAEPVYYDGQANYFYNGSWYYRNGGNWNYWHSEPGFLRNYRGSHTSYVGGRARGNVVRGGARGGSRGGGRGGRR